MGCVRRHVSFRLFLTCRMRLRWKKQDLVMEDIWFFMERVGLLSRRAPRSHHYYHSYFLPLGTSDPSGIKTCQENTKPISRWLELIHIHTWAMPKSIFLTICESRYLRPHLVPCALLIGSIFLWLGLPWLNARHLLWLVPQTPSTWNDLPPSFRAKLMFPLWSLFL